MFDQDLLSYLLYTSIRFNRLMMIIMCMNTISPSKELLCEFMIISYGRRYS